MAITSALYAIEGTVAYTALVMAIAELFGTCNMPFPY